MKKIKYVLTFLFISCSYYIFSQNNFSTTVISQIQKDALFREKVFIHLNKTTYFSNENIWLTVYVAEDSSNTPSNSTTNLHINVLNQNGDIIVSKVLFIKNGVGVGDIFIDEKFGSGKYYIQGYTNYMQNFGTENVFIQEIEIINPSVPKKINSEINKNIYDIQVFPESGYLLEDTNNTIGIKVLINGKGYPFSGKLKNSKGLEIATFKGNQFGMGKCDFIYERNEVYVCLVEINDTIQKISLPKAKRTGIIFSLDNTNEQEVKLTIKTNKETLPSLKDETLNLLFYRNNFISEASTLYLSSDTKTTQELFFNKNNMLNGVNIVTLFSNNKPIAERKFFIEKSDKQTAVLIEELSVENDSINFKIQTVNSNYNPILSQLSVSILPENCKVFYEKQNIKSAFLLSPYVKGHIENPSFYFKNKNSKEKEYLDLLLMNQGWSTYTLEEKVKEINPKEKFHLERGFTLKGEAKLVPKEYDVGIISKKNRLITFSKLNDQKEFSFENIFAYKNDTIKIALIKKGKPLIKPSQITLTQDIVNEQNYSSLVNQFNNVVSEKISNESQNMDFSAYQYYPSTEILNEIVLKDVKSKQKETLYDLEMNLASNRNVLASESYKNKKVTKQMEISYQTLFDYFMNLGYIKPLPFSNANSYFISLRAVSATLIGGNGNLNPDKTFPPIIYLDDAPISNDRVIEMLQETTMAEIDEVLVNKSGAGGGLNAGTGGIIKIYRKKGDHEYFEDLDKNLYEKLILLTGFDRASAFFKPFSNLYSKDTFDWSEIYWYNSLQTNEEGEVIIKIPTNEFSKNFQFVINGFSKEGLLFYDNYKVGDNEF